MAMANMSTHLSGLLKPGNLKNILLELKLLSQFCTGKVIPKAGTHSKDSFAKSMIDPCFNFNGP